MNKFRNLSHILHTQSKVLTLRSDQRFYPLPLHYFTLQIFERNYQLLEGIVSKNVLDMSEGEKYIFEFKYVGMSFHYQHLVRV